MPKKEIFDKVRHGLLAYDKEAVKDMEKMIVVDIDSCTGCGCCELACSFKHHGEFNPIKSRIHKNVFLSQAIAVLVVCYQCKDPLCGKVCPAVGAITTEKDPGDGTTVIRVHEDKCVGCKMCMLACPYGCIVVTDNGYAEKCDLCSGDPECVKVCRLGAIKFDLPQRGMMKKKRATAERLLSSYKKI